MVKQERQPNHSARRLKVTIALAIANLCVLTLYLSGWTYHQAQEEPALHGNERLVAKGFTTQAEPVEFASLKVKGIPAHLAEKFEGEADWLQDVTIRLTNRAAKPITWARIDIDFPETGATGHVLLHQLFVGRHPDLEVTRSNPPLRLLPHDSLEVSLAADYGQIKRLIELRYPSVNLIHKATFRLGEVLFDDDTLWSGGHLFKRNPDAKAVRKWLRVSDEQFVPDSK
ncbi:MAG TPA: hypothetical protein VF525_05350 [Pyrinomonadaceae bacterium]|jgi:hypothetical protein